MNNWFTSIINAIINLFKGGSQSEEEKMGLIMNKVDAKGPCDPRNAKVTCQLTRVTITQGSGAVALRWTPHKFAGGDGICDGWIVIFWKTPAGQWMSGAIEHCPNGKNYADGQGYDFAPSALNNMKSSSYNPKPIKGNDFGLAIVGCNSQQRSNIVFNKWPI